MRALKITAIAALLAIVTTALVLIATLTWLVKSEQGSRWLIEQGLPFVPVPIEARGISGALADGLGVDELHITLPAAEIQASGVVVSWRPASLLAGIVDIRHAYIAELDIDIISAESSGDPVDDDLFWLLIPLRIDIAAGQLDQLRIDQAVFEDLKVAGSIGHGKLEIESVSGQTAGVQLQASGKLDGPAPGDLAAKVAWEVPAQDLMGSGSFSGNIESLDFNHVIKLPDVVNFKGTIHDLFESPSLTGVADWSKVRLPGERAEYIETSRFSIQSDFRSARIDGNAKLMLEGLPGAPVQLQALVDLEGVAIESYRVDMLDGQISGDGRIEFREPLTGRIKIDAARINTALLNSQLPGELGFASVLLIESVDRFVLDITAANARVVDRDFNGTGKLTVSNGKPALVDASIVAGGNRLTANVELEKQLAGRIDLQAPDLGMLWPGLQGKMQASIDLAGSMKNPQGRITATAQSVAYEGQSLKSLAFSGEVLSGNRVSGELDATGLVASGQQLGNLDMGLSGTLAEHSSVFKLQGGVVDLELHAEGGWDGEYLNQRFDYGYVQPDGFERWQLEKEALLRLSAARGHLGAHCWKQARAGICIDESSWDDGSLQTAMAVNDFALASLRPLLQEGYSIEGSVDADLKLLRNVKGLQGELHLRQSRTVLSYSDEIDTFTTTLDEVRIDVVSNERQTNLEASLSGEEGMNIAANAKVSGPLVTDSPLKAEASGRLSSIGLLRPLVQRVAQPGELEGELRVDLKVSGTLGKPIFTGGAYLAEGKLGLLGAGVTLSGINMAAESRGGDKLVVTGELYSGQGKAEILGEIRATQSTDLEADIRIQGQNLATLRVPDLTVDTSPDLRIRIGDGLFDISGNVLVPTALAEIRDLPQGAVPMSPDVVVHAPEREADQLAETRVTGDVEVTLGENVQFRGFGLDSRLGGGLRLRQARDSDLRTSGTVRVREGFLTGYGRELRVDRGELTFTGPLDDPLINIQVSRESIYEGRQYTIGLRLTGSARNVHTQPFSRPALSERDIVSFLLLDRPASSGSDASGAAIALGLQQLLPDQSGRFGLDEVSFETNDANEAAMVAGKRINEDLHVRYVFGSVGAPGSFRIRYRLGRGFSLEASTGARQALDLIYLLER
jgi:translocation and assembly module TamB